MEKSDGVGNGRRGIEEGFEYREEKCARKKLLERKSVQKERQVAAGGGKEQRQKK